MSSSTSSPFTPIKAKALVLALGFLLAGSVHAPRVEASGVPTVDVSAIVQSITNFFQDGIRDLAAAKVKECFDISNLQQALQRIQSIQRIQLRPGAKKISDMMPAITPLDKGVSNVCPGVQPGSYTQQAAGFLRSFAGLGMDVDNSADLRQVQNQLCIAKVVLENQRWNRQRELLVEVEDQMGSWESTLNKWNAMAAAGGSGGRFCALDNGGANEGFQSSMQKELVAKSEDDKRRLEQKQAEIEVIDKFIASINDRQQQVGMLMLRGRGQSGGTLGAWATSTIESGIRYGTMKKALDSAKTDTPVSRGYRCHFDGGCRPADLR